MNSNLNILFLRFFLPNPFLRRVLHQKIIVFFFAFWGLGLIHFVATARDRAYLGLWDCSPFLQRHTNVDQLHSKSPWGIQRTHMVGWSATKRKLMM